MHKSHLCPEFHYKRYCKPPVCNVYLLGFEAWYPHFQVCFARRPQPSVWKVYVSHNQVCNMFAAKVVHIRPDIQMCLTTSPLLPPRINWNVLLLFSDIIIQVSVNMNFDFINLHFKLLKILTLTHTNLTSDPTIIYFSFVYFNFHLK